MILSRGALQMSLLTSGRPKSSSSDGVNPVGEYECGGLIDTAQYLRLISSLQQCRAEL